MTLAAALAATHLRAFQTDRAWTEAEFAGFLTSSVVIFAGDATAFVLGRLILDEAEILTLATDPAEQCKGRARAALDQFEGMARQRGAATVFLEVAEDNTAARQLYAKARYVQVGQRAGYYHRAAAKPVAALTLRKAL